MERAAELLHLGGLTFELGLEKGGFRSQHAGKDEGHFRQKAQRPSQKEETHGRPHAHTSLLGIATEAGLVFQARLESKPGEFSGPSGSSGR